MQIVDPFTLPSLPLSQRRVFPRKVSVIYFALSGSDEVLYIGRAVNFYARWNGQTHHRRKELEEFGGVRIAWMEVSDRSLLPEIEFGLIEYFRPRLNGANNAARQAGDMGGIGREKTLRVRLNEKEWERLEKAAAVREISMSQIVRDFLKTLDTEAQAG